VTKGSKREGKVIGGRMLSGEKRGTSVEDWGLSDTKGESEHRSESDEGEWSGLVFVLRNFKKVSS
jgi:hypothetical protein